MLLEPFSLYAGQTVDRTFGIDRHLAGDQDRLDTALRGNAEKLPGIRRPAAAQQSARIMEMPAGRLQIVDR